jgi:hypothetical protein
MSPAKPRVARVDLVRASARTSLLRVDVAGLDDEGHDVALLVGSGDHAPPRRLTPLPTAPGGVGGARISFALPTALRLMQLRLVIDDVELPLVAPPERAMSDAVAAVALRQTRARLAELERRLAEQGIDAAASGDDDPLRARLEQQLAEHRLLRAQLARELQNARDQSRALEEELRRAEQERDVLAAELESHRAGSLSDHEQLAARLQQAHARVEYLERRVVEVQAQATRSEAR